MKSDVGQAARDAFSYRRDDSVPSFPDDLPIVIFDGKCVMCSGLANLILRRDRAGRFRLLAAQSPLGEALYRHFGLDPVEYETNILIDDGRAWFKSEASIRILEHLGFPWSMVATSRLLPLSLRDRLYDIVARNRLRWFGERTSCYMPQPADTGRFL